MNSLKNNEKKINLINRLKYADHKVFCICIDVKKVYGGDGFDKLYDVLSTLKKYKFENKQYPN